MMQFLIGDSVMLIAKFVCGIAFGGIVGTALSSICTISAEDRDGGQATVATALSTRP